MKTYMEFRHLPVNAIFHGLGATGPFIKVARDEYRRFCHLDRSIIKAGASVQQRTVRLEKVATRR